MKKQADTICEREKNMKKDVDDCLITSLKKSEAIYQEVDGYYYFDPNCCDGILASHNLRTIADELDLINKETSDKQKISELSELVYKLKLDLYQHCRVSEYNLSGKDLNFPDDPAVKITSPMLITKNGLNESLKLIEEVETYLKNS